MLVGGLAVASCFCPALAPIAIAAFTGYVSGLAISVGTSLVTSTIQNGFGNYDWNAIAKQANKDAFWGAFSGAAFAGIGAAASNVLSKAGPKAAKSIRDVASYTNKVDDYIDDAANLTDDILNSADDVVKGGLNSNLAQYGDDFGKMGQYVENPNIKVDWSQYAAHGAERMQQRGMTQEMIENIIENGKVLSQSGGNKFAYITREGVAVVSKEGKLITGWTNANFDEAMINIVGKLFGE